MSELLKIISTNVLILTPFIPGHPPIPGFAGTPFVPGYPGHPAYCDKVLRYKQPIVVYVCGVDVHGNTFCFTQFTGRYVNVYDEVCYEAVPPTPGTPGTPDIPGIPGTSSTGQDVLVIKDRHIGWNGSAISVTQFNATTNVKLTFRTQGVSAVCGLNDQDVGSAYTEIDYAFFTNHGIYQVMENGVGKTNLTSYVDHDPCFAIIRFNGQVMYYVWVSGAWSRVYTSTVHSTAPVFVDASIYMGGDLIG